MRRLMGLLAIVAVVAGVVLAASTPAATAEFPIKGRTITILSPYTAGGSTDLVARLIGAELEKTLGTPVQVSNRPGAGGQVALSALVQAKPDGYTLAALAIPTTLATYMDPARKAIYSRKSFQPLARISAASVKVVVRADSPYKTLKDLIDAAKANPEKLKMAAGTQLSGYHLNCLHFQKETGTKFALVNFDGGIQGVNALLGGHVDVSINQDSEIISQYKAGAIRLLGLLDSEESSSFPGVKTLQSQGYNLTTLTSNIIAAPAGTPKEVVDLLSREIKRTMADAQYIKKSEGMGLEARYLDGAQTDALWAELETNVGPFIMETLKK
jgi:tripartite-type tricarboxylate transporter receptor subunit TctC